MMLAPRLAACMVGTVMLALAATPGGAANSMSTGGLTSQPIGHYEFCKILPDECTVRTRDESPLQLTQQLWEQIVGVNLQVNSSIRPMNDQDIHGRDEVWSYPRGVGDCEDYVLQKRRFLQQKGIPLSSLLITVVRKSNGEGHAVLTVRTDRGDFVLDNLTDSIWLWNQTGYNFLKRQAAGHTGRWVTIRGTTNPVVGSVRR